MTHLESAGGGRIAVERDVRIRMRDGVQLSADVYRPDRPGRFGAILEHIPYRKDDLRALQDRGQNLVLAAAGFVCVRLDVRGTGGSEGVAVDEYTEAEQLDGVEMVDWMARQEWCNGNVGSWGKSYGGFSCIQLAARRPPALRAIAPVYATDDRYTDDMHFDGGAVAAFELGNYPVRMIGMNALPPGAGEGPEFDARWRERIDSTPAWVVRWLTEQKDGPYWRNGSLRPDYERIECPVFIVSGWHDGYRTAGLRMARRLRSPWQLLAGPWTHVAPDRGVPRPVYPFMRELVAFFRTHLDPGSAPAEAARRPRSIIFIEEHDPPGEPAERVSGAWIASESWPESAGESVLTLGTARVAPPSASVGLATGNWCPPPPDSGLFGDQRADEAASACFESEPLPEAVEVLGAPRVRFRIAHPGPRALVSVKLNDVAPGGASQPVTRGAVNLACDGEAAVELDLMATGWRFRPGHRIRVAVAANDWPCLWPLPRLEPLGVTTAVELRLPGLPDDARPHDAESDVVPVTWTDGVVTARPSRWEPVRDPDTGMAGIEAADWWAFEFPQEGLRCEEGHVYSTGVRDDDPLSARVEGRTRFAVTRPGLDAVAEASGTFTCTETEFVVELDLAVTRDGEPFHRRRWRERIARDGC
ncbi:MAG TPA: CocE/NonD family hydrolase [Gaiellales bacterium]|nr:CocE/NonD family hydrolase [Gaiellales bacterium]